MVRMSETASVALEQLGGGVWLAPGARIIDRFGERRLPWATAAPPRAQSRSVLVDKAMLIADVIDGGATCTLFCCPADLAKRSTRPC